MANPSIRLLKRDGLEVTCFFSHHFLGEDQIVSFSRNGKLDYKNFFHVLLLVVTRDPFTVG